MSRRMRAAEEDMPSLPLPPLPATLAALKRSIRAVATDEEYAHSEAVIDEFAGGAGPDLHAALEERASSMRNWLEDWWLEFIYLRPRWPIAVWMNYLGVNLSDDLAPFSLDQTTAAALMLSQVLKFRQLVVSEELEPETLAGRPLCMDQYTRMFNSCRVPGVECDELRVFEHTARHVVVLRNNRIFSVRVLSDDGRVLPFTDILCALDDVLRASCNLFEIESTPAVSVLTSEDRAVWAKARTYLMELATENATALEAIETAICCVSLERHNPTTLEERASDCLLGSGLNRWYDKPFTIVAYPNGLTGLNGEHTWADAMVVVRQQDFAMRGALEELRTNGVPRRAPASPAYAPPVELRFQVDAKLMKYIEQASMHIGELTFSIELRVLQFKHFGRNAVKRFGITPDFFMQMAIQLAHWRLHKEFVATYETAHTRLFHHGRTETIRTTSLESVAFCKAMTDEKFDATERYEKLRAAVKAHGSYVKDCMLGQGIDRHLLGLQIVSEIMAGDAGSRAALFTDPGFLKSRKFALSTSNISMGSTPSFGGYAPFFKGGYGVCYSLHDNMIHASITHAKGTRTDASALRDAIRTALVDVYTLCAECVPVGGAAAAVAAKL